MYVLLLFSAYFLQNRLQSSKCAGAVILPVSLVMKRDGLLTLGYNWNNVRGRGFGYDLGTGAVLFAI